METMLTFALHKFILGMVAATYVLPYLQRPVLLKERNRS